MLLYNKKCIYMNGKDKKITINYTYREQKIQHIFHCKRLPHLCHIYYSHSHNKQMWLKLKWCCCVTHWHIWSGHIKWVITVRCEPIKVSKHVSAWSVNQIEEPLDFSSSFQYGQSSCRLEWPLLTNFPSKPNSQKKLFN